MRAAKRESNQPLVLVRSIAFMTICCSKLVGGAETTPVPAIHANRNVNLAHHDGLAIAHVASITLDQIGAQIAAGGETGGVVEDAAVAAVRGIPGNVAR